MLDMRGTILDMNSMLDEKENYEISGEKRRVTLFNTSSCKNEPLTRGGIWRNAEKAVLLHRHSETMDSSKTSMTSNQYHISNKIKLTTKKQKAL